MSHIVNKSVMIDLDANVKSTSSHSDNEFPTYNDEFEKQIN